MKTWLAGILATIISGVVVYYLTLPKPAPIDIAGFVVNEETNALVSNAVVTLVVHGSPNSQSTDTEGRYYFEVEGGDPSASATLRVQANAYKEYSSNGSLQSLVNLDPKLTPLAGANGDHGAPTAQIQKELPRPNYTRRPDAKKIVLQH